MSSKQTAVLPNRDEASVNAMPYTVAIAGKPEPRVKAVRKVSALTGDITIHLTVPVIDGVPLLPVATMDATARRIAPTARVSQNGKGTRVHVREYAV